MMMHPDILKKAQEEIDLVVGNHRLPDFEDRPSLPYLECIVREVFRYVTYFVDHFVDETAAHADIFIVPVSSRQFLLVRCSVYSQ